MYHELTDQARTKRMRTRLIALLVVLALIAGSVFAFQSVNSGLREQAQLSMSNAVLNAAKQCFAIEGSYPASLTYLEENYGVVINHDRYVVNYEVFAENVMPSVVVIAR